MARKKKDPGLKRPVAVTVTALVIVVLFFVRIYQAVKPLVEAETLQTAFSIPFFINGTLTAHGRMVFQSLLFLVLAIGLIVVLIAFLRMRRWSWVLMMAWVGFSMVVSLVDYFYFSEPNYVIMASDVIIAFALSQGDVQRIFRIRSDTGESIF
jgi:hypothetical protein